MRSTLLSLGLAVIALATTTYVVADTEFVTFQVIQLNSEADLDQLRQTNPAHYAQATRIMAAANHLCRPQLPETVLAKYHASKISCSVMLLKTSNPPKRQINFQLDNTYYSALVTVTDDPPRLVQAH
jgi:hypothetical protein